MMFNPSLLPSKARVLSVGDSPSPSWRRVSHGSTRFEAAAQLRQPQDGAIDNTARVASITSRQPNADPMEPEDARLTGDTRSLYRRLMGLNVMNVDRVAGVEDANEAFGRKPQLRVLKPMLKQQVA